jgi:predicted AlkP superfamily pyrophosphatase or phosphodiesterase
MSLARRLVLAALVCVGLSAPTGAVPGDGPRLIVLVVVDQMRADYIDRYAGQWTGGLKRLLTSGAWFRNAAFDYANTVTCAGHGTISTGTPPLVHGLILNTWWDRETGGEVACTHSATVRNIGYTKAVSGGDSVERLRGTTLTDTLRADLDPSGRTVSLSLKARSAATLGGHHPEAVLWFDAAGTWTTSTAFTPSPLPEVERFIANHPVEADFGQVWSRALPVDRYLFAETAMGVTAPEGMSAAFPHRLDGGGGREPDATFYEQWQNSPFSDAYLGRMALDLAGSFRLEQGSTNALAIGFSALDKVGHDYGPHSHEVQDVLIRLDRTLGELLTGLDRLVGDGNYVVALTGDHGVAPLPEWTLAMGLPAGRVEPNRIRAAVEASLTKSLGRGPHVRAFVHTEAYLTPASAAKLEQSPAATAALRARLLAEPGVAGVFTGRELRGAAGGVGRAIARSHVDGRSGDLTVIYQPYWIDDETGTSHGSPYAYDARVPIVLMGKGILPGTYLTPASPMDIAPTLALLAGVTLSRAEGRVLAEAVGVKSPSR